MKKNITTGYKQTLPDESEFDWLYGERDDISSEEEEDIVGY